MADRALTCTILGNFLCEPLREYIRTIAEKLHLRLEISFGSFDQPVQSLLEAADNPDTAPDFFVLYWETARPVLKSQDASDPRGYATHLAEAVVAACAATGARAIVVLCPPVDDKDCISLYDRCREYLLHRLSDEPSVDVTAGAHILELFPAAWAAARNKDPTTNNIVPFAALGYSVLATVAMRRLRTFLVQPKKVLLCDCDETLWQGACSEGSVVVTPAHAELQHWLVKQVGGGRLLCLLSKNDLADVLRVFEQNDGMILSKSHIVCWKINWKAKHENAIEVSGELGLGLNSFVFFDDSPVECAAMRSFAPSILTIQVGSGGTRLVEPILNAWDLDVGKVTVVDKQRPVYYADELRRKQAATQYPSLAAFIRDLNVDVKFSPASGHDFVRVAQLLMRTNQFNLNGRLFDGESLFRTKQSRCEVIHVSDTFGDYGVTGVIVYTVSESRLIVHSLALSCRVLGRGVEERIKEHLFSQAETASCGSILFEYVATSRNTVITKFLNDLGAIQSSFEGGLIVSRPLRLR
jgi:FkbH-like protein